MAPVFSKPDRGNSSQRRTAPNSYSSSSAMPLVPTPNAAETTEPTANPPKVSTRSSSKKRKPVATITSTEKFKRRNNQNVQDVADVPDVDMSTQNQDSMQQMNTIDMSEILEKPETQPETVDSSRQVHYREDYQLISMDPLQQQSDMSTATNREECNENDTGRTRKRGHDCMGGVRTQSMELPEDQTPLVYAKKSRPVDVELKQNEQSLQNNMDKDMDTAGLVYAIKSTPKTFQCHICNKSLANKKTLKFHLNTHNKDNQYKCTICDKSYPHPSSLRTHISDSHDPSGSKEFKCGTCDKIFRTSKRLRDHQISVHEENFVCPYCGKNVTKNRSKAHLITHDEYSKGRYHCEICKKAYNFQYRLNIHLKVHDTGRLVCDICGFIACSNRSAGQHRRIHITTPKGNFKCKICMTAFLTNYRLNKHLEVHNTDRLVCDICGFVSRNNHSAGNHRRIHIMRRFECVTCSTKFPTVKMFLTHIRSHITDTTPFLCLVCGCVFSTHDALDNHKSQHEKEFELHTCVKCGQYFKEANTLKYHIEKHCTFSPKLTCPICHCKLSTKTSLKKHVRLHSVPGSDVNKPRQFVCGICHHSYRKRTTLLAHTCYFNIHQSTGSRARLLEVIKQKYAEGLPDAIQSSTEHFSLYSEPQQAQQFVLQDIASEHTNQKCGSGILSRSSSHTETQTHEIVKILGRDTPKRTKSYTANCCGKTFKDRTALQQHARSCKLKRNRYVCPTCGNRFQTPMTRLIHTRNYHGGGSQGILGCRLCSRRFNNYALLHRHMRFVHGVRQRPLLPYRQYGVPITKPGRRSRIYVGFSSSNIRLAARARLQQWECTFRELVAAGWTFQWRRAFPFPISTRRLSHAHDQRSVVRRIVRAIASIARVEAIDNLRQSIPQIVQQVTNVMTAQQRLYGQWKKPVRAPHRRNMHK